MERDVVLQAVIYAMEAMIVPGGMMKIEPRANNGLRAPGVSMLYMEFIT